MIDWPLPVRAFGAAVSTGVIKKEPEHFRVREYLGFEADGEGEHVLLTVRKRNANTLWVARALARHAKIHPREIGFSGLKDRQALTEQAFTAPLGKLSLEHWQGLQGEGFEVLSAFRQRRKLRRGAHKANDFYIVIDELNGDPESLRERLDAIARCGVPNYFGPQRFGRNEHNLQAAAAWFIEGREPRDRVQRGFALSAARAAIFNQLLAQRVNQGNWNELLVGDVANLNGSGSVFCVEVLDEILRQRCTVLDIHPTGPLWGRGELSSKGSAAEWERALANQYAPFSLGLEAAGLQQERRALRAQVANLAWTLEAKRLILEFRLLRGMFATAVLAEIIGAGANGFGEDEDA
jgi:tRNA pseudouridine13 synthase